MSPELQIFDSSSAVNFLNGLFSLITTLGLCYLMRVPGRTILRTMFCGKGSCCFWQVGSGSERILSSRAEKEQESDTGPPKPHDALPAKPIQARTDTPPNMARGGHLLKWGIHSHANDVLKRVPRGRLVDPFFVSWHHPNFDKTNLFKLACARRQ